MSENVVVRPRPAPSDADTPGRWCIERTKVTFGAEPTSPLQAVHVSDATDVLHWVAERSAARWRCTPRAQGSL